MVDVLNAVGVQWATLGNHEFDVPRLPSARA
jgi:2',3'-cyclic-nucleotide 2'-phosphodiesterase (5'-nucleotidase family)